MKKKVTIRDIAKEAGVSIATVSYVLNNREDQSISETTRQKILQIVNLHQYRINFTAKCISSGKTGIITLYVGDGKSVLQQADSLFVAQKIYKLLEQKGHHLQIAFCGDVKRYENSDAIICYNVDSKFFRELGEINFCPLIALDTKVKNDELFYQINTDFLKVKSIADEIFGKDNYVVLSLPISSADLYKNFKESFKETVIAEDSLDSADFSERNAVVLGETLGAYVKRFAKDTLVIDTCNQEKLAKLWQCLDITINRLDAINHDILI